MINAEIVVDMWLMVKEYVPAKDRKDAAAHFVQFIDESGVYGLDEFKELFGSCDVLDDEVQTFVRENGYSSDEWEE